MTQAEDLARTQAQSSLRSSGVRLREITGESGGAMERHGLDAERNLRS